MPLSLSYLLVHLVFSTKDRAPWIGKELQPALHAYLATVARNADCEAYRVGGVADHVHLAIRLHRSRSIADLVVELKTSSSQWVKDQGVRQFAWQRGYGAFSVGPGSCEALVRYIDTQESHHRKQGFQEEFRRLLSQYGIDADERYLWD